jgi:hypothetical protein
MVSQIGRFVKAHVASPPLVLVAHLLGGTAGGAAVGICLGFAGLVIDAFAHEAIRQLLVVGLPVLMVIAGLIDLRVVPVSPYTTQRQTPKSWSCTLGNVPASAAWGADLGLLFATRVCTQSAWILPVYALLSGSFWTSVMVMALFGTARSGSVITAVALMPTHFGSTTLSLQRLRGILSGAVGIAGLVLGVALLITAGESNTHSTLL